MATTAMQKKARPKVLDRSPMTAQEAEESLSRLTRLTVEWTEELLGFSQRRGWAALGYESLPHCLSDRLKITTHSAMHVFRAALTKHEMGQLTTDRGERERILALPDSCALRLRKLPGPKARLQAYREATAEVGSNGATRVTAVALGRVVRRLAGLPGGQVPRSERLKCPRCDGRGWIER